MSSISVSLSLPTSGSPYMTFQFRTFLVFFTHENALTWITLVSSLKCDIKLALSCMICFKLLLKVIWNKALPKMGIHSFAIECEDLGNQAKTTSSLFVFTKMTGSTPKRMQSEDISFVMLAEQNWTALNCIICDFRNKPDLYVFVCLLLRFIW